MIESAAGQINRVLPETSLVMAFRYRGQVSYAQDARWEALPVTAVTGVRQSGRLIHYEAGTGNLLVLFRELGAVPFFKESLLDFKEQMVSLYELAGYQQVARVEDALTAAKSPAERVRHVEHFLHQRLSSYTPDVRIQSALAIIKEQRGQGRIRPLADSLALSQDVFEKRFRRAVGMSPKQWAYIIRMRHMLAQDFSASSLAEIAYNAGYFDQAHFNKDFKRFTGQTPTAFLQKPPAW